MNVALSACLIASTATPPFWAITVEFNRRVVLASDHYNQVSDNNLGSILKKGPSLPFIKIALRSTFKKSMNPLTFTRATKLIFR